MPWPIRFGPAAEDDHRRPLARRDLGLLVVGRVVVRRARRRTRPRRCRRSCRPAGSRARAGRRGPRRRSCRGSCRSGRRRSRAAWPGAAAPGVSSGAAVTSAATSLISSSWSTNHGSIPVAVEAPPRRWRRPAARPSPCAAGRRAGARISSSSASLSSSTHSWLPVEDGVGLLSRRAQRLLQRLGEVAADRHRLADRLHVRGQRRVGGRELLEREPRHLHHDVVEGRLEARRRLASAGVMSLGISSRV